MLEHYVYVYLNPLKPGNFQYGKIKLKFEPFYIGKGKSDRYRVHITNSKKEISLKSNTIRKIIRNGKEPIIIKLYEGISDYSSIRAEKYLIKLIGRRDLKKGPLSNLTDGGEGPNGIILSKETKDKISNSLRGRSLPEDHPFKVKGREPWNKGKKGQEPWNKGKECPEETKDKISNSLKGRSLPEDHPFKVKGKDAWNKGLKTGKIAHNANAVIMLSLDGEYINKYPSVKAAMEDNPGCTTIRKVCIGKNKTSGGYIWKFEEL